MKLKFINPLYKKYLIVLITSCIVMNLGIIGLFHLSLLESFLLFLATPVILFLVLKLALPPLRNKARQFEREFRTEGYRREEAIKKAKAKGYHPRKVGAKKQHTVYAKNHLAAARIYREKIAPLEAKNPKKQYYIINDAWNNLK